MKAKMEPYLAPHNNTLFITDGGLETTLVFDCGIELPHFAAFDLLFKPSYRGHIIRYYEEYLRLAGEYGTGFILDTVTWRANPDWLYKMGYERSAVLSVNMAAVELAQNLRKAHLATTSPILISGCIGPRRDGYIVDKKMEPLEARSYHFEQIYALHMGKADLITAMTINYKEEALGITQAAALVGIPVVISFTVETDGKLPDGNSLNEAIEYVDTLTNSYPTYYMINCAHPTHFMQELSDDTPWKQRVLGVRANASCKSHQELNDSEELDRGDRLELSSQYAKLKDLLPGLQVFGGCCGTDITHIEAILNEIKPKKS